MTDVGHEALRLLTLDQVSELLGGEGGVSVRTVRRLVHAERRQPGTGLRSVKVGTRVLVAPEDLLAYKQRLRGAA